jgi:hypothetical protein
MKALQIWLLHRAENNMANQFGDKQQLSPQPRAIGYASNTGVGCPVATVHEIKIFLSLLAS